MSGWIDAERRVERAQELYGQGRLVEAAAELRAAIHINPHTAAWYFNLGLTMEALEDYAHACQAYEAALRLQGHDLEALCCLGVSQTRLGKYAEALKSFERIEQIDPTHEPSYCNRIVTYCEMGDHEKAELMFYLARLFKDECPICYYNIATSLYSRGHYPKAIYCWKRTLELDKLYPQANACIAEAYWAQGKLKDARGHYLCELMLDPDDIETLGDLGEVLIELREYDLAGVCFRRALWLSPDSTAALFGLGRLAVKRERWAAAEAKFRTVLELDPRYPGVHCRLGEVLIRRGQKRRAVRHLLSELKRCGDDPGTLQEVGWLLIEVRQVRRANSVLERLVRLRPGDAQARHNLAVSYFLLNRLDEGIVHCRRALKLRPDYPLALYNLALAHMQKGQVPRARRYAVKAMEIAPDSEQIRQLFHRLRSGNGVPKIADGLNLPGCLRNIFLSW